MNIKVLVEQFLRKSGKFDATGAIQGCELIGRLEKVSIGDQMETTFEVKRRPFGDHFEDNWRPNIKLSVVSRIIGCNIFGLRKMALLFLYLPFCLQFAIFKKYIKPK